MVVPSPPSPPEVLALASKWALEMGKKPHLVEVRDKEGSRDVVLVLTHNEWQVNIQARGGCIIVMLLLNVPEEVRKNLERLPEPSRYRLELNLRHELTSNARTAFTLRPRTSRHLEGLERIVLEQLMRISEEDPSSFNRLADAIQEVVTAASKASDVLIPFFTGGRADTSMLDDATFPSNMYV